MKKIYIILMCVMINALSVMHFEFSHPAQLAYEVEETFTKQFNQKLKGIMAAAKLDGLNAEDIHILVEAAKLEVSIHQKAG